MSHVITIFLLHIVVTCDMINLQETSTTTSDGVIDMASIDLDFAYCADENGRIPADEPAHITDGIAVSYNVDDVIDMHGMPGLTFTGTRDDLVTVIRRYETDAELVDELIDYIRD